MEDPIKCCKEVGVVPPSANTARPAAHSHAHSHQQQVSQQQPAAAAAARGMCLICAETTQPDTSAALSCGHTFCLECWQSYLSMKIQDGETAIVCPAVKCSLLVDEALVRRLVKTDVYDKYVRFVTKAFVETNPAVRYVVTCSA